MRIMSIFETWANFIKIALQCYHTTIIVRYKIQEMARTGAFQPKTTYDVRYIDKSTNFSRFFFKA